MVMTGPEQELMTCLNQLKPSAMLQNIPNQHMLVFFNRVGKNILNEHRVVQRSSNLEAQVWFDWFRAVVLKV